jgi:hypothetical protein
MPKALQKGFVHLTTAIVNRVRLKAMVPEIIKKDFSHVTAKVLMSTDRPVLEGILAGTLAEDYFAEESSPLRQCLDVLRNRAWGVKQPCIYMNVFTDKAGKPPLGEYVEDILEWVEIYCTDKSHDHDDDFYTFDSAFPARI